MVRASRAEPHAHGLAVFAAAAFLLGMGLIAVLERVGAPDGFVRALGPLIALLGLGVVGFLTRAHDLLDFLSARRAAPALYGGLAFAATAAGLTTAMASAFGGVSALPSAGVAAGLVGSALLVAPGLRGAKATALADVLATAFPAAPTRIAFAVALGATGLLTAIAGFDLAADALVAAIGCSRRIAEALVALALAISIVPGGFKGLLWSDAASGGGALLIAATGAAIAVIDSPAPFASLATALHGGQTEFVLAGVRPGWGEQIAAAVGIAGFFALTPPAIAAGSKIEARRSGLAGLAFVGIGLSLIAVAAPYFAALPGGASPTAVGLTGAATWLPALALARAGVLGVSRAGGFDLATAHSRLAVLASRRIALHRLAMLATIALLPWFGAPWFPDAGRALLMALAIQMALVTPALAMATLTRPPAGAAGVGLGVGLVVLAARLAFADSASSPVELLITSLTAGVAALIVGVAFALMFPRRGETSHPIADPFVAIPLDGID